MCYVIGLKNKNWVVSTLRLVISGREIRSVHCYLHARELKEFGFKHDDLETYYMSIVRLLLRDLGKNVRLNHLFMYLIENINSREVVGFEMSDLLEALIEEKLIKAVDVLVRVYASLGRFEEAMHTLSEMKSKGGLMVSTKACNFVLNELIEWDQVYKAELVYAELKSNGLVPNVYTYEVLMKGYCREGRCEEARCVFDQMRKAGVEPNAFIYGRYIHMLCSKGETYVALHVIRKSRESNQPGVVDVFAYACLIRGLVDNSDLQVAEYVLRHYMEKNKVVPDADCYGELIQGYRDEGDTDKALDLSKEMESRLGIKTEYVVMRVRMLYFCGQRWYHEALNTFKEFMQSSSKVYIDKRTFDLAIDAACQLGKMEDAMELVEGMKDRKMKLWRMHYRTLIDGYCLRGEPWNALYMFQEMMRNGLRPDSTTYYVLARGFKGCGISLPLYMLFKL